MRTAYQSRQRSTAFEHNVSTVKPEDEARARELFFAYDGSEFFMSRDGADAEYTALKVPKTLERVWMRELTDKLLAALDQPGNWKTIYLLSHHWDFSHVREVLKARPKGVWWERVAYLENLLDYVRTARWLLRASGRQRAAAARIAIEHGEQLLAEAPDHDDMDFLGSSREDRLARVEGLLRRARRRVG